MAKLTRFERSQKAHSKYFWKHNTSSIGNPRSELKSEYHFDVLTLQRHANKVLPKKERKIIYNYKKQKIFGTKTKVKPNEYLSVFRKYNVNSFD